ncbi:MAG: acyl-ACP--UDP-N-acetylglucosamine O-acyltransferase [Bacteroidales bacterium]|jgi:UDP-N-acetylglucosamine acyltransferase|nr:acyl-ACP--UDP-N-acetylglucosamine O-acyltransferase [Bacteroidales bacterium]
MIHPLSYIHPEAKIGENVTVEPFASISGDVVIGEGTKVFSNAVIMDGARIGKNCLVLPGAVIAGIPQDLKFKGEYTTVEIGDNTTVRECVTINRGTVAKGKTIIGNNCLLMAYVHIAHDCCIGNNCVIVSHSGLAGEVEVDDWVIISGGSLVHQFVRIGAHVMVAGASRVRKDIPPFVKAGREPLAYIGLNSVGLRRRGFPNEKIYELQDIYRILYQSGMNHGEAIKRIEENFPDSAERSEVIRFVQKSKRGIMKGYLSASGDNDED